MSCEQPALRGETEALQKQRGSGGIHTAASTVIHLLHAADGETEVQGTSMTCQRSHYSVSEVRALLSTCFTVSSIHP